MARWLAQLQEYTLRIEYREGRKHLNADALSRRPVIEAALDSGQACPCFTGGRCRHPDRDHIKARPNLVHAELAAVAPVRGTEEALPIDQLPPEGDAIQEEVGCAFPGLTLAQLQDTQSRDPELTIVRDALEQGHTSIGGAWRGLYSRLELIDGVVRERTTDGKPGPIAVPITVRPLLIHTVHNQPCGGHDGVRRTCDTLRRQYVWPGLRQQVHTWVQGCQDCQRTARKPPRYVAPLRPLRVSRVNQLVGIDLTGPLTTSHRGNKYILVAVEYLTRHHVAVAIPDKRAETVARAFLEHYVLRHGVPERVLSDQGQEFEADVFRLLCQSLGIEKLRTTAYHPQANGMVERFNRTLASKLRCVTDPHQRDWDDHLPYKVLAYNTTVHTSTKQTPFFLRHGHEARLPTDLLLGAPAPQPDTGGHPHEPWLDALRQARAEACRAGEAARQRHKAAARPRTDPTL
ncbi:hypothetical protein scyTo_0024658, partial [Scyliorhinus torazame]|nr:hypothetical protein [Scyliorhinus torazame]